MKRPAGSSAQAYGVIVAQPDWLDKPSSGLSLYAAQPWVIAFPRNQVRQPHEYSILAVAGRLVQHRLAVPAPLIF